MANLLAWIVIIAADLFSISFGFYSAYKFIMAFLDGRDLFKNQGYLFNAFFLIVVFPLFITFGGMKVADLGGKYAVVGIGIQTNDLSGANNRISFSSKEFKFEPNGEKSIDLRVINDLQENQDFSIDISCTDERKKCDKALDLLVPKQNVLNIDPKVTLLLPITLNLRDNIPKDKYSFNITVKDKSGSVYDSIPLTISVK